MAKVEFLLKSPLENITASGLNSVHKEYLSLLIQNKFPLPKSDNYDDMITFLKRKDEDNPVAIGPYKNITIFEAANRIATDLVIINGLKLLIDSKKIKDPILTLRLGTTHEKGKGDFTIKMGGNEFEGEAFNVAPSFLKHKLYRTTQKWTDRDLEYILINAEAFENVKFNSLDTRIIKVVNWSQLTMSN